MRNGVKFLIMLIISVTIGCTEKVDGIKISGVIEQDIQNGWVSISKLNEQGTEALDTAYFEDDLKYEFVVNPTEPTFYLLNFNGRQQIRLLLDGNEELVEVNADGFDPNGYSEISGSYSTQYLRDIDELIKVYHAESRRINGEGRLALSSGDTAMYRDANVRFLDLTQVVNRDLKQMVWDMLPSPAAFYGVQRLNPDQHFSFVDSVSTELSKALPNSSIIKKLAQVVESKRKLTVGAEAPEIALPSPDGEVISLSSLKGNYVLIDFWAAWCRPCRAENPNVVRMYKKYQDKNFEILGVSLDRTKEAWVGAIQQDGLPWLHVSDLGYWNSSVTRTYQISAIPATYLIDPEGKIIAKNLRGPSLAAKLQEIFG